MIRILLKFIKWKFRGLVRSVYWMYKLSHSTIGSNVSIEFPVIREGKGFLSIGDMSILGRKSFFGIGNNGACSIGKNSNISTAAKIVVAEGSNIEIGSDFRLGANTNLYVHGNWSISSEVHIETNCSIFAREPLRDGNLVIGSGTHVGDFTIIDLVADVIIGKEVAIGPNCTLYTHDHEYDDISKPSWKGGLISKEIVIEDGAWIGSGVTILPGVKIGKRAVIAAGALVNKDVPANSIYGGVPAKLLKEI